MNIIEENVRYSGIKPDQERAAKYHKCINTSFAFQIKTFKSANDDETENAKFTTKHILLGVTSSVPAVKSPSLINAFSLRFLFFCDVCFIAKVGTTNSLITFF